METMQSFGVTGTLSEEERGGGGGGVEGQLRRAAGWKQVNAAPKYEAAHQCLELAHSDNRVQWGPVQELLIWLHT